MISQPLTIKTDGSGAATAYSEPIGAALTAIIYTKGDYDAGCDFTITDNETGETLWTQVDQNSTVVKYPRVLAQAGAGTDLTGWYVEPVVTGTVKVVIAQGGNAKSGTFRFVYDED